MDTGDWLREDASMATAGRTFRACSRLCVCLRFAYTLDDVVVEESIVNEHRGTLFTEMPRAALCDVYGL